MSRKVERLSKRDQRILALMSQGMREMDICLRLRISAASFQKAYTRIEERAQMQSNDAGRFYERAMRRYAEASRESLEARFNALMTISPNAILVADGRTGKILQANDKAAEMFGYSIAELTDITVEALVPLEQQHIHRAYRIGFLASVRKREMGYHPPIMALRKDGSTLEIAIALTASTANDEVMVVCAEFEKWSSFNERERAATRLQ